MNLVHLLTREEPVAGLEISDSSLRLAFLALDKASSLPRIVYLLEQSLPEGTIVEGVIKNEPAFLEALGALTSRARPAVHYVIVSLPADNIYAKIFSFPAAVRGQKLEQSIQLTIGFQLPIATESYNLDWESAGGDPEDNKILLAAVPKSVIGQYVALLSGANLNVVAVELHALSIARCTQLPAAPVFITIPGKTSTQLAVIDHGSLGFSRVLPSRLATPSAVSEESDKVREFYEAENGVPVKALALDGVPLHDTLSAQPQLKDKNASLWLVSLGAALRGLLPRAQDNHISLLPVGTEEAYERQKAIAFAAFLANMTIAVAVFFIAAYVGVWLMVVSLQQRLVNQVDALAAIPAPVGTPELEQKASSFNQTIGTEAAMIKTFPHWSTVLSELNSRSASTVIITNVSLPNPESPISVSGVAPSRGQLNLFKKLLDESPMFTAINLPLTNLQQKENIPFTITMQLRDPQSIYGVAAP